MLVYFLLLFAIALIANALVEIYGVPYTGFKGELAVEQSRVLNDLSLVADLKKERLMRWFEERIDDSTAIANSAIVKSVVTELLMSVEEKSANGVKAESSWAGMRNTQSHRALTQHLKNIKVTYGVYEEIDILDARTLRAIASTNDLDTGAVLLPDPEALLIDLEDLGLVVRARSDRDSGRVSLAIYRAIRTGARVAAVLAMSVNTDDVFGPMIHVGGGLGRTGEALLVDQEVRLLTSLRHPLPDGSRPLPLKYRITAKAARLSARGEEGIVVTKDYRGVEVLAAYRHLNITPEVSWGLVVKKDRFEVSAHYRARLVSTLYRLLVGAVLLTIAIWVIARRLTSPIVELSLAAEKIAGGDLDARAPVSTNDEVGQLSTTFNAMVARVAQRTKELEVANRELKGLDQLKSMFIASMSHELRTPLNSIIGFTSILLKGMAGELNEEQARQLTVVKSSSKHLLGLINDIIDVSKIETDKVDIFIEEFDLAEQLAEIKDSFATVVTEKGLAFSIDAPDKLPVVSDERRTRQIVVNLVSNAIKFTDSGDVKIRTFIDGDTVEVSVHDTGVGIREEDIGKLFEPFSRIALEGRIVEGSGLGLYLSQKLAALLGGEIRVESEFGKGSVFTLTLPLIYKEARS